MNNTPRLPGQPSVPAQQCIETLHQILGQLEALTDYLENGTAVVATNAEEIRVRRVLQDYLAVGKGCLTLAELEAFINEALVQAYLEPPVGRATLRRLLPALVADLFDSRPSRSVLRDGKFCRGFRGLVIRQE
jgi:hypothetical protein